ncbi:MAG: hypothetical protein H0X24_10910 [Ktedonobacterales bacterium]|nr:hypothetical protein [Ktedonobacterales bacterium]
MLSMLFPSWESPFSRFTATSIVVLGLFVAMVSAGCGSTIPPTYACNGANSGCYGVVHWSNTLADFGGKTVQGAKSALQMRSFTCNAACQAEGGYIGNYLMLSDSTLHHWLEIGYRADVVGTLHYFIGDDLLNSNIVFHTLSLVNPADINQFTIMSINHYSSGGGGFEARLSSPTAFGEWTSASNPTQPGAIEFGQILHGTQGAGSTQAYICVNRFTSILNASPLNVPVSTSDFLDSVTSNGTVVQQAPPWARWITLPQNEPGGDFGTDT